MPVYTWTCARGKWLVSARALLGRSSALRLLLADVPTRRASRRPNPGGLPLALHCSGHASLVKKGVLMRFNDCIATIALHGKHEPIYEPVSGLYNSVSARPYESCKIFKGRPRRNAFSKLVHRRYKSFQFGRFCQLEIKNTTRLSNKHNTA